MTTKPERDIEQKHSKADFVAWLRRVAAAIERSERFSIDVAGERVDVPADVAFSIEHERSESEEELEFQLKWHND